jgi:hypothetical protein
MNRTENKEAPSAPSPIEAPDSLENPIKPPAESSKTAAEIPKVGTKDAPGG